VSNRFIPLDCDDDVVLLEKDTFKISRLKELVKREIRKKLQYMIYNSQTQMPGGYIPGFLSAINVGEERIQFREITFNSFKNCQILQIAGKGWQKGKLKIQISIDPNDENRDKIYLEFCPDEPNEPESPLDDIRKRIQAEQ
jgi:hypothetical protein